MNGIVHPCSHPEDRPPPSTEEEMMLAIFKYTDRVVNMVRPRKLLLIAVGTFANAMPNSWIHLIGQDFEVMEGGALLSQFTRFSLPNPLTWLFRRRCSSCEDESTTLQAL